MKETNRLSRVIIALVLSLAMSAASVFAEPNQLTDQTGNQNGTEQATEGQNSTANTPAPAPKKSQIVKKGKYYYYKNPSNGKIRKKKGFVRDNGNLYYIKKGGKIQAGKTFRVTKKKYRAAKNGVILAGVYKWGKKLYYSDSKGVWIKTEKVVSWKGNKYYIQKGGVVITSDTCSYKNIPYIADSAGRLKQLAIPASDGNPVVEVAKKQVGIMTGKTYWVWYFKTKFRNTDATPWCGAFVAWCYNKAGLYSKISGIKSFGNLGYVPSYSKYANTNKKWISPENAKPGDIIIFGSNRHVGLVEGISDGCIITIEGNSGPTALIRGKAGAVTRKAYTIRSKKIKGVMRVL